MANRKLIVEIIGDSKSFEKALLRSESAGKRFSRTVGGIARSALIATGALSGGFAGAAFKAVQAASDLNEEVNKTDVVFGSSAEAIQTWSKTTSTQLGIARAQALAAAGGFGQLLQTAGLTETVAADFSKTLVQLAADMASFNNIDPSEALLKLRSGLAGEAEPLRTVGVLLSEARVKQEAYAAGIAAVGAKLTEAEKVQARYNLILKDTGKQQGDFERTSDSLANATRKLRAQFTDIAARLGTSLLPTVQRITNAISNWLAVSENQERLQRTITNAVNGFAAVVRGLRDTIVPVVNALGGFRKALQLLLAVMVAKKVLAFAGAIKALGLAAGTATTRIGALRLGLLKLARLGAIAVAVNVIVNVIDKQTRDEIKKDASEGFLGSALLKTLIGTDFGLREASESSEYKRAEENARKAAKAAAERTKKAIEKSMRDVFDRIEPPVASRASSFKSVIESVTPRLDIRRETERGVEPKLTPKQKLDLTKRRNQFFDARIDRQLDRTQDTKSLQAQLSSLTKIEGLLADRIAKTKDITRRLNLEDRLLDVQRRQAGVREQISREFFAGLEFKADVAAASGSVRREVAELQRLQGAIEQQIRVEGATVDLQRDLLNVQQRIKDVRAEAKATQASRAADLLALKLDKAEATGTFADNVRVLREQQAAIRKQIAEEGNTLHLQRELFRVQVEIADTIREQQQARLDRLSFRFEKAEAKGNLDAALRALKDQQASIKRQISETGRTLELERELFRVQQDIRRVRLERRQSRQFRTLGLTGEGQERVPGVEALRRSLKQVSGAVEGSFLDTRKTQSLLSRIRKVLGGGLGDITQDVRAKIREMLEGIRNDLKNNERQLTKTKSLNTKAVLRGLGLDPDEVKALRARLSKFNTAGRALASKPTVGALGQPVALAGTIVVQAPPVFLDGQKISSNSRRHNQTFDRRNPAQKRGRIGP